MISKNEEQIVDVVYVNYRNETSIRTIMPVKMYFGTTSWYPKPQWLLEVTAYDKGREPVTRVFAMENIRFWIKKEVI